MKMIGILLSSIVVPCFVVAETDDAFRDAVYNGAMAKIVCRVVDDDGVPVSNAVVHVWFSSYARPCDDVDWLADTDSNGYFIAQHRTNEQVSWLVKKDGYYQTYGKIQFRERKIEGSRVVDGKWQPYGETRTVVLKKIKNPGVITVPKCLIRVESIIPKYGEWIPFDLERFDWAAPYGGGSYDDVLLRFRRRDTGRWNDFTYEMDVSFTNHPYAGVVKMKKDSSSDFVTVYNADPSANYIPSLNYFLERTGNGGSRFSVLEKDSYLIFRTRTSVDEKGRLKTAHYGTILGEWMPGKNYMSLADGCFNCNPNDTNIEDGHQLREILRNAKWRLNLSER